SRTARSPTASRTARRSWKTPLAPRCTSSTRAVRSPTSESLPLGSLAAPGGDVDHTDLNAVLQLEIEPELLTLALTHRSYAYENGGIGHKERLEFLGDSILGQAVTVMLYLENPDVDEGELAKRRASLVSSAALAEI